MGLLDNESLDAKLQGKSVYVEVQVEGGALHKSSKEANYHSRKTMIYFGTYQGSDALGKQEFVILAPCAYYNSGGIKFNNEVGIQTSKLEFEQCLINTEYVISIGVNKTNNLK